MRIDPPWTARYALDAHQVRATITAQFPQLACDHLEWLGSGWDNDVWRVDHALTARFPRRKLAVALLEQERRILPKLLGGLPIPTAAPTHFGQPDEITPHPYNLVPFLTGTTCCRANPTQAERAAHARPLGEFLRALHSTPLDVVPRGERLGDVHGRADLGKRTRWFRSELSKLHHAGILPHAPKEFITRLDALGAQLTSAPAHERCWVHGDLYVRHVLLDESSRALCGVIDWGDVHVGDPALDLGLVMTYLPDSAHDVFCEAYGWEHMSEALWSRAVFLSLRSGLALLGYGTDIGDTDLIRESHSMLDAFLRLA